MILLQHLRNIRERKELATTRFPHSLPVAVHRHTSLIRRCLGNVETELQDNKAVSPGLTAPKIDGIVIAPGERFSFWHLAGRCSAKEGYREGMTISNGRPARGMGGGMCQFTDLLHWMVLHSPLTVVEHRTHHTFQFRTWTTDEHLHGELRADTELPLKFHVRERDAYFHERDGEVLRHNRVHRIERDKRTGEQISDTMILENEGRIAYDPSLVRAEILPARPENTVTAP